MADESGLKTLKRGDVINGRYEIVRPLGDGMLGATFLAKHMASDKHVAIKFIHARLVRNPKDRERLEAAFRSKGCEARRHHSLRRARTMSPRCTSRRSTSRVSPCAS